MNKEYNVFYKYLTKCDKYNAIRYAKELLKTISIAELYENILGRSLIEIGHKVDTKDINIWHEHMYSSIIISVIENCYNSVIENALPSNKESVIVACPQDELHDIGARMVSDFFTVNGYDTTFIGCNTPTKDIVSAIVTLKPDYIALSVTDYYNLSTVKDVIKEIKNNSSVKVIVGGSAFVNNSNFYKEIGADYYMSKFSDIVNLKDVIK